MRILTESAGRMPSKWKFHSDWRLVLVQGLVLGGVTSTPPFSWKGRWVTSTFTFTFKALSRCLCPRRLTISTFVIWGLRDGVTLCGWRSDQVSFHWVLGFLRKMGSDSAVLTLVKSSFYHWGAKTEKSCDCGRIWVDCKQGTQQHSWYAAVV